VIPGSLSKRNALSKIEEQRIEKYSHVFSPGVLSVMQETEIGSTMETAFDNKNRQTYEAFINIL